MILLDHNFPHANLIQSKLLDYNNNTKDIQ